MADTTAKSGQPYKKNSSTIFNAGSAAESNGAGVNSLSPTESLPEQQGYGSALPAPVEVASSGNIGFIKVLGAGTVNRTANNDFIVPTLTDTIAGVSNTTLKSGASDFGQTKYPRPINHQVRLDEASWNYETGALTKGAAAGVSVNFHGTDGTAEGSGIDHVNPQSYPASSVGEFITTEGKPLPTYNDFPKPNNI